MSDIALIPSALEARSPDEQSTWFADHRVKLTPQEWDRFYGDSTAHRGLCCVSCIEDKTWGYGDDIDGCCCKAGDGDD